MASAPRRKTWERRWWEPHAGCSSQRRNLPRRRYQRPLSVCQWNGLAAFRYAETLWTKSGIAIPDTWLTIPSPGGYPWGQEMRLYIPAGTNWGEQYISTQWDIILLTFLHHFVPKMVIWVRTKPTVEFRTTPRLRRGIICDKDLYIINYLLNFFHCQRWSYLISETIFCVHHKLIVQYRTESQLYTILELTWLSEQDLTSTFRFSTTLYHISGTTVWCNSIRKTYGTI